MKSDDVPDAVLDIAKDAAAAVDLNWCGVIVVVCSKTGNPYILEVNRRPGLTEESTERIAAVTHFSNILAMQNFA